MHVYSVHYTNKSLNIKTLARTPVHNDHIGILPKGPYPSCLRMADRALFAGYPRYMMGQIHVLSHLKGPLVSGNGCFLRSVCLKIVEVKCRVFLPVSTVSRYCSPFWSLFGVFLLSFHYDSPRIFCFFTYLFFYLIMGDRETLCECSVNRQAH